jgi:hypothetical protein
MRGGCLAGFDVGCCADMNMKSVKGGWVLGKQKPERGCLDEVPGSNSNRT